MSTTTRNRALEETPNRALTFLRAVGLSPEIRRALIDVGYTDGVHQQGWSLLTRTAGLETETVTSGNPVADAIRAISDWNSAGYVRIRAALTHMHPQQAAYVFKGLESATGVASVIVVQTLLDRLDSMQGTGPDAESRKGHEAPDKRALETLAARGIDTKERARLRDLIKIAQSAPSTTSTETLTAQESALRGLKAWLDDWSETARAVIKKRADLIRLGLAKRQSRKTEEETDATQPGNPAPQPVAPAPRTAECAPPPSPTPNGGGATPVAPVPN